MTDKLSQIVTVSKGGRSNEGGINKAERELGLGRMEAHRAVKIAGLTPEAKKVAIEIGLDDNQSALLKARDKSGDAAKETANLRAERSRKDAGIHNKPTVTGPPLWTTVDGEPGHSWLMDEIAAGRDHLVYAAQIMLNLKSKMSEPERNKANNAFLDIATRASRCAAILKPEGNPK